VEPKNRESAATRGPSNHLQLVDQLRGFAILLVLFHHLYGINFHWVLPWVNGWRDFSAYGYESVWVQLSYLGRAGVPLFFVLSGFCIHLSCLQRGRFEVGRFFWQRFWRLYPAYFIVLALFSYWLFKGHYFDRWAIEQFLTHALLIHNYSSDTFWGINPPFWSIAVEVQLYLLYPLLLAIRSRAGWRGCFLVAGFLSVAWLAVAGAIWGLPQESTDPVITSPLNTWIDWCLGAWIAECYVKGHRALPSNRILPFVTLACFVASTIYQPLIMFNFFLASLTSALWLDHLLHREAKVASKGFPVLLNNGIAWFGLISYSFYLWHEPILQNWHDFVWKHLSGRLSPGICIGLSLIIPVVVATLLAYLSFRFIEKPGIQLGRSLLARGNAIKSRQIEIDILRQSKLTDV
jgi:peptidoglycan/LPS O-acetylase OafA/YrhL